MPSLKSTTFCIDLVVRLRPFLRSLRQLPFQTAVRAAAVRTDVTNVSPAQDHTAIIDRHRHVHAAQARLQQAAGPRHDRHEEVGVAGGGVVGRRRPQQQAQAHGQR